MVESIEFGWRIEDFDALLESCQFDEAVKLSIEFIPEKNSRILEAGCGTGRVVKYLSDLGYENIYGLELNKEIVNWINQVFPELKVDAGNILTMRYPDNYFDRVLSYGVVEHFRQGLDAPLISLFNVLTPGGLAVITVPSFNTLRVIKDKVDSSLDFIHPKRNPFLRRLFRKPDLPNIDDFEYLYHVYPRRGPFFEYRLTRSEFEKACEAVGFNIIQSIPISHLDGLYHELGPPLIYFSNWSFRVSLLGTLLNRLLRLLPFFHNHMHACVLQK